MQKEVFDLGTLLGNLCRFLNTNDTESFLTGILVYEQSAKMMIDQGLARYLFSPELSLSVVSEYLATLANCKNWEKADEAVVLAVIKHCPLSINAASVFVREFPSLAGPVATALTENPMDYLKELNKPENDKLYFLMENLAKSLDGQLDHLLYLGLFYMDEHCITKNFCLEMFTWITWLGEMNPMLLEQINERVPQILAALKAEEKEKYNARYARPRNMLGAHKTGNQEIFDTVFHGANFDGVELYEVGNLLDAPLVINKPIGRSYLEGSDDHRYFLCALYLGNDHLDLRDLHAHYTAWWWADVPPRKRSAVVDDLEHACNVLKALDRFNPERLGGALELLINELVSLESTLLMKPRLIKAFSSDILLTTTYGQSIRDELLEVDLGL
jgi:hypothetical protein